MDIQEKAIFKALETPEEKRARRLAKKLGKEKKKKELLGWDDEHLSYTNVDNPFGDPNLHRPFIWRKKFQKEGKDNISEAKLIEINKTKLAENKIELEKVKKRRWLYEKEKEARQTEVEMVQREKEAAQFKEWEKQEDKFHLEQALLRSEIRMGDNRAKPIDLLAKYIGNTLGDLDLELHEPYTYLNGLTINDLEDLLEDIKVYIELEHGHNVDFWKDITIIAEDELEKLKLIVSAEKDDYYSRRDGINKSVRDDVIKVFKGKTYNQLEILASQITHKIQTQENIDISYWESLLKQLNAYMAKARLRERHQELLKQKLLEFKREQQLALDDDDKDEREIMKDGDGGDNIPSTSSHNASSKQPLFPITNFDGTEKQRKSSKKSKMKENEDITEVTAEDEEKIDVEGGDVNDEVSIEQAYRIYEEGCYTPERMLERILDKGTIITTQEEELKKIEFARSCYKNTGHINYSIEDMMLKQVCDGIALADAEELQSTEATNEEDMMKFASASFNTQVALPYQEYLWRDKYKPRKPRFFNRVHTGFEWNKYNQTHYDIDNPPPKIVQGYKFNIFYPDLINKMATPTYTVTPCYAEGENKWNAPTPDFAVLRFSAGPPYEDIAFKIVNREWETSFRRGFRCQFYNNIFQLWFHFKRYRYRR